MSKPFKLATPRPGKDGKTYWTDIGTMWPMDGNRFSINLDALPIPQMKDGKLELRVIAFPPKDDQGGSSRDDGGDIPF